jgi:signal peptidase I
MNSSSTVKRIAIPTITNAAVAVLLLMCGCSSSIRPYRVIGNSMRPLIASGDRIFVDESDNARSNLHDGDVVLLRHRDKEFVKRIIAMQGETISGDHGKVIRDGKQLEEPYLAPTKGDEIDGLATFRPRTLSAGEIFIMGDNREVSADSRLVAYGPVYVSEVVGKYIRTYWHAN